MKLLGGIKHLCDGIWCGSYNNSFIYGKSGFIYKKCKEPSDLIPWANVYGN